MGLRPVVSVVVPYYDDQLGLDRLLAALERQDLGTSAFEVVVADDGSPRPPEPGRRPYPVQVLRQHDGGFRAAAARNLGAAATSGDLLCFLDGDVLPAPGYLREMFRAAADLEPRSLLVGRRRHAELTGRSPDQLVSWLADDPGAAAPPVLEDPAWLADAYHRSDDLRCADEESYRYLISAVMTVSRPLWQAVGGFDESFTAYGGEDWELANRCWLAGAELRHVPRAVAWHDGPDLAGRDVDRQQVLQQQALNLALLLPSPALRPPGPVYRRPVCAVEVDDRGWDAATVLLVVASLLRGGPDVGVWLREGSQVARPGVFSQDPRVHRGPVPPEVAVRARWRVALNHPVALEVGLDHLLAAGPGVGRGAAEGISVQRTRDLSLAGPSARELPDGLVAAVPARDLGALLRCRYDAGWPRAVASDPASGGDQRDEV